VNQTQDHTPYKKLIPFAAVIAVYLLMMAIEPIVNLPMRNASAVIAEAALHCAGIPVTRLGTTLQYSGIQFDVEPACSGSTLLRVLFACGLLLCLLYQSVPAASRFFAVACLLPIAIVTNSLRIAFLAGCGFFAEILYPGSFSHELVGIVTFILAMGILFRILAFLASPTTPSNSKNHSALPELTIAMFLFIHIPFLSRCILAWTANAYDRDDRLGLFFVLAAALCTGALIHKTPTRHIRLLSSATLYGFSLLIACASIFTGINFLLAFSLLAGTGAFLSFLKGRHILPAFFCLGFVAFLGFPSVARQLRELTDDFLWFSTSNNNLGIRIGAGAVALAAAYLLSPKREHELQPDTSSGSGSIYFRVILISMTAVVLFLQQTITPTVHEQGEYSSLPELTISYLQGDWIGKDTPVMQSTEFRAEALWSRQYQLGKKTIMILVSASDGDLRRNHPPEYCLTSQGWAIDNRHQQTSAINSATKIGEISRLTMTRNGTSCQLAYWFTNGDIVQSNYSQMVLSGWLNQLYQTDRQWFLFRVIADDEKTLTDFLHTFRYTIPQEGDTNIKTGAE